MTGWTTRADSEQCCKSEHGPISNNEEVARLVHDKIMPPEFEPFPRSELFPQKKKSFSNECGNSDGASITRINGQTEKEVQIKSQILANSRPGRSSQGALLAEAKKLRNIEINEMGKSQIVFIYDDPRKDEPFHGVIRASEKIPRSNQDFVRNLIKGTFDKSIPPITEC